MSFSQRETTQRPLSTSQINCHKGSEVALAPPPLVRAHYAMGPRILFTRVREQKKIREIKITFAI